MIAFENVTAGRMRQRLTDVSLTWEAGLHCVVGGPSDGAVLLFDVISGRVRPRTGVVRVLGGAPNDPRVRKHRAEVLTDASVPDALRVGELLTMASTFRGDPVKDAAERLDALGLAALVRRPIRSLSRAETRSVALVEALTAPSVRVLLVEEPFVTLDPRAAGRIREALREKARAGCAVVVATGSLRDAYALGDDHLVLRQGTAVGPGPWLQPLSGIRVDGTQLLAITRDAAAARTLMAVLARDPRIDRLGRDGPLVCLTGVDPVAIADATGRASVEAKVDILELRFEFQWPDDVRSLFLPPLPPRASAS